MALAMAEAVVSGLVSNIVGNFDSLVREEFGLVGGLQTELQNLRSIFTTVQAVLQDAEEKQRKSEALKTWLRELKDAAYDADDVLDEFAIEAQRRIHQRDLTNRVRSWFSPYQNPLIFRLKMANKLKNVRAKFDSIAKKRHDFHLTEGVVETESDSFDWRVTGSLINESEICGRDNEKEELINRLLTNSADLSVYAVCGMGGLGKTTLAQLVYNDAIVNEHFDLRIWVCVSDDFDVRRLARAIIESIERSPCPIQELDPLQRRLQEKVIGKRFLLILDDIWDHYHEKWNKLKNVLRYGARGSVVVITTRMETVARQIESNSVQQLGRLSDYDSWRLFERLAFGLRRREEYVHLETIGKAIVNKCGGVPLAIKTVGNLMRLKRNKNEWLSIKSSDIWDQQDERRMVLSALMLSYNNLPPHLKQCFAFCSMFQKDSAMKKDQLVELWMANGFIPCKEQMDLHEMGHQMFDELVGRSFFQDVEEDGLGNVTCKMHDLIHDLAHLVMSQESCLIEDGRIQEIPKMVRHVAFFERYSVSCTEDLVKGRSLRSLLLIDVSFGLRPWRDDRSRYLSGNNRLRILTLNNFLFRKLPKSISNMKHLRHLDLSQSVLTKLPEAISSFQNLQTLNLRDCWLLYMLPKGMQHMKSLIYLDLRGCDALRCMPTGMGQLTCLQKLSMFIVGKKDGRHIGELQRLSYIGGELSIKDLGNVEGLTDAKNANLTRKTNLQSLSLSWRKDKNNNISEKNNEDVLCGLKPHSNLKKLKISGYGGSKFPDWMMELLLPNLVEISLESCMNCEHLPPFGKLQFLKHLSLKKMDAVKCIGSEMYGDGENPIFPLLEKLTLGPMKSLELWTTDTMCEREIFTRVHHLSVENCHKLVELPVIPSVKELKIKDCNVTVLRSVVNFPSITSLYIHEFPGMTLLPDGLLQNHMLIEFFSLNYMPTLETLSNQLGNLSSIKTFVIANCKLESLPQDLQNLCSLEYINLSDLPIAGLCGLPSSLAALYIDGCKNLSSLSEGLQNLTALKYLHISGCHKLNSLPESVQHLTSLRDLSIMGCDGLSCLPNQTGHLTSLSILSIWDCPKLISLPEEIRSLDMLRELEIQDCPNLEKRCKKERGEDWPKIAHIPTIVINKQLIQSLEKSI